MESPGHLSFHSWQTFPHPFEIFMYTSVALESYEDSGVGTESESVSLSVMSDSLPPHGL